MQRLDFSMSGTFFLDPEKSKIFTVRMAALDRPTAFLTSLVMLTEMDETAAEGGRGKRVRRRVLYAQCSSMFSKSSMHAAVTYAKRGGGGKASRSMICIYKN